MMRDGLVLSRQTGNGMLNSILSGDKEEADFAGCTFFMECWDLLPVCDFEAGLCEIEYHARFERLEDVSEGMPWVGPIPSFTVSSMVAAYAINSKHLQDGFEGSVIKDPASIWKDHTSPYQVKLKIAFEAEYLITGMYEGTGKAAGMMGGISITTSDDLLKSNCGSGFSDEIRKQAWQNKESWIGSVATIIANDVVSSKSNDTMSLFLPIFSEIRLDKKEADSLPRVLAQLEAAKNG